MDKPKLTRRRSWTITEVDDYGGWRIARDNQDDVVKESAAEAQQYVIDIEKAEVEDTGTAGFCAINWEPCTKLGVQVLKAIGAMK